MSRWILRGVLVICSTLVGILVSEWVVRLFAPQPLQLRPNIWMPADGLGYERRPYLDTIVNTGERPVRLLTDGRGHRIGPEGPPASERRILAVGDSFVAGLQVDYRDLVTTRLSEGLAGDEAPLASEERVIRPRYAVINAGVTGWNPSHYYRKVRDELSVKDYDLVLLFVFVGNDVVFNTRTWHRPRSGFDNPIRIPTRFSYRAIIRAWIYPTSPFKVLIDTHTRT